MESAEAMAMSNIATTAECLTGNVEGRSPMILIAEDATDTRLILARTLEFENYKYILASSGEEAVEKALRYQPDIMLLDLMLPKLNGFQVLMRLKSLSVRTKVCVISSIDKEDFIRRAIDFGAVDYIVKPVFPDAVSHKVRALLGRTASESYFKLPCSLAGMVTSDSKTSECLVRNITEASLTLQTDAPFRKGDVVSIGCPSLNQVLDRDIPLYARLTNVRTNEYHRLRNEYECEIIALSETQRQRLRAQIIRGKFLTDEVHIN